MTPAELDALPDVTSRFSSVERIVDGKRLIVPVLLDECGPMFQGDDDGVFEDAAGVLWVTGWVSQRRVRRRKL